MTLDLTPRVTAPSFSANPLAYYRWHLKHHPKMYAGFRTLADQYRAIDPTRRVSADMICHTLRYHSGLHADDDQFTVNNNMTPLFARLYRHEREDANVETRTSQLDALTEDEWAALLALLPQEERRGN